MLSHMVLFRAALVPSNGHPMPTSVGQSMPAQSAQRRAAE